MTEGPSSALAVQVSKNSLMSPYSSNSVSVTGNTISGNTVDGNLNVIGVQNYIAPQARNPNALLALIARSKVLAEDCQEYRNMVEELQSFLATRPRKIIGLEAKLQAGGRADLVEDAIYLEGKFTRRLAQGQHSPSTIEMFVHCLSQINLSFSTWIYPLMQSSGKQGVDAAIKFYVIDPIYEELTSVDCSLSVDLVRGMLYFLTGKCHVVW